ncbi:MAG: hypothetical protein NT053_00550 [Cyanobacteria bacterium]|nr:hypothetical protein [Cyanobacteriota bacterium]
METTSTHLSQFAAREVGKYIEGKQYMHFFGDGEKAKELEHIVIQHALLGSAAAFIPVPGADVAAMVATIWSMYARINNAVGVSLNEHALRSIASAVVANVLAVLPAAALAVGIETIFKLFPGIGTAGGIATGIVANVALMYVSGMIYLKSLEALVNSGKPLTEENIRKATQEMVKDSAFVKEAYQHGKDVSAPGNPMEHPTAPPCPTPQRS